MSTKDQAWAERVGREAAALGFDVDTERHSWSEIDQKEDGSFSQVPDFRDRLTELACIAWVEDVAREVHGIGCRVVVKLYGDGICGVEVFRPDGACVVWCTERETLAEECIAAVRAMKGGE